MLFLLLTFACFCSEVNAQLGPSPSNFPLGPESDSEEEEHFEKEILVIPNHFPKDLNFFCYPYTPLIRDRLCFGQLDSYALACADGAPPLQLVPFCLAFKNQCSQLDYPSESFCEREMSRYRKFCSRTRKQKCKSCTHDISCSCEPYACLWGRHGQDTAVWCQRYDLFCDKDKRRDKANALLPLLKDSINMHYRCLHMFNLPETICDPFKKQFDWHRCMKFLFDCELISEWDEEPQPEIEKEIMVAPKEMDRGEAQKGKKVEPQIMLTKEDEKVLKKISEEEELLDELIKQSETKAGIETNIQKPSSNETSPMLPQPVEDEKLMEEAAEVITAEKEKPKPPVNPTFLEEEALLENTTHPFASITLPTSPPGTATELKKQKRL